jgi:hypothetical protein
MRYLVLFLFIFWFYPFAELARRAGTFMSLGRLSLLGRC